MDMINTNSFRYKNVSFDTCSISLRKQAKTGNEPLSEGNDISDVDCFQELYKKFPNASFAVSDSSLECTDQDWLPERFLDNSKLQNFSNPGTVSIIFDKKIFEKAADDPRFMEDLTKFTEDLNNQWAYIKENCLTDGMKYIHANVFLYADGTIGYTTTVYKEPHWLSGLYFDNKNNLSGLQDDNIAKRILEEYEKQKLEGLFDMMDKIHENSKKLNEQIKHDKRNEELKMEEYEKTFIFGV